MVNTQVRVFARKYPPAESGPQEGDRDVLVTRSSEPIPSREDRVLEHCRALNIPVDDMEIARQVSTASQWIAQFENLGVTVVRDRLGDIDLT